MTNKERLVLSLLAGVKQNGTDIKVTALLAIGESGLIDDDRLVDALEEASEHNGSLIRGTAYTAMGHMLKNSNRQ